MIEIITVLILVIYGLCLTFIFLYSLSQLHLVYHYLKPKPVISSTISLDNYPFVTIQLPIYNELYVVERLLEAVSNFNYPKDKFEIQVLDDSTDETSTIIQKMIKGIFNQGISIFHIQRENRKGFKAGALQNGLELSKGEYVVIFDADFVPDKNFLIATLPFFSENKIGAVQTRWTHLNQNYSILTRLQAFGLDAHFSVEQKGRNASGSFINFNGTAGIWRKECIIDAGGWQADTLTEDLDLSYRAQLRGWKLVYNEDIQSPAELPIMMSAIKSQQFRWNKGAAQTAKKNIQNVLNSPFSFSTKIHAFFHLLNSSIFICIAMTAALSIPILFIKNNFLAPNPLFLVASFFLISLFALIIFYWTSLNIYSFSRIKKIRYFTIHFPLFLAISMGLSLHNAIAVIEGFCGIQSSFVRTPKFNISINENSFSNKYISRTISLLTILEVLMAAYFGYGIYLSFVFKDFGLLPFHILLAFGFSMVSYYSIKHVIYAAKQ